MPSLPFPDPVREFLTKPNPAVMASLRSSGQPVTVPTWYILDGDRILVNVDEGRTRLNHLRSDPRVAVSVMDKDDWYTHVSVQGRVAEIKDDPDMADIDRIARHYTGQQYSNRDRGRVSVWLEVDRWHGWGAMRQVG